MRAFAPVLLILVIATPVLGDEGVRLAGTRYTGGSADRDAVLAWARQAEKTDALEEKYASRETPPPALVAAREKLAALVAPLGKAWPQTWEILPDRARHEASGSVFLARFDAEGFKAQLVPDSRQIFLSELSFARQMTAGTRPGGELKLVPTDGPAVKIFGLACREHRIEGRGAGEVWIATPEKPLAEPLKAFFALANQKLGGYPGSILHHAVTQAGGVPVLARFEGVKGMTLSGNSLGGKTILAFPEIAATTPDPAAFELPEGWSVVRLPPR